MHDAVELSDANLVAESLSGDRDAFGRIVERYQTLIASLAEEIPGRTGLPGRSQPMAVLWILALAAASGGHWWWLVKGPVSAGQHG